MQPNERQLKGTGKTGTCETADSGLAQSIASARLQIYRSCFGYHGSFGRQHAHMPHASRWKAKLLVPTSAQLLKTARPPSRSTWNTYPDRQMPFFPSRIRCC